jgi:hypothetical protein
VIRRGGGSARDVRRDEFTKVTDTLKTVNVTREGREETRFPARPFDVDGDTLLVHTDIFGAGALRSLTALERDSLAFA